ncbi:MAG: L,D-transpeptidase family protein [Proteobacteria bacterium]|nr:L,D-transpeptidase family protein [Pseudomonadota bacterium]
MTVESVLRVIPATENQCRGHLWWRDRSYPCALGRGGVLPASRKREGDGASPAGLYPLLGLYYRADRLDLPEMRHESALPAQKIAPHLGWCDDPGCDSYNSAVNLPHPGSAESLMRGDSLYDLLVVLGHNQNPAVPGRGSAIFLHVARDDFSPTQGCVAIAREALLEILPELSAGAMMRIHLP